jgi:dihydroxyacetone kinase-like predicted kinase
MHSYSLEFILNAPSSSTEAIRRSLLQAGEHAKVSRAQEEAQKEGVFQVHVQTKDPTLIFDICSQFGRISSIKIEERKGAK